MELPKVVSAGRVAGRPRSPARQGEGGHPGARRAGRRTPPAADGPDREGLRLRGPGRKGEPARSLRGPPPAHRLPLHVPPGRRTAGCPGCSLVVDNIGHLAHLHARDTSFALVSRAPLANIEPYKRRMGWTVPWFSSFGSDFNDDFGVGPTDGRRRDLRPQRLPARRRQCLSHLLHRPAAASRRSAAPGPSST